jgi:hypothetical protein
MKTRAIIASSTVVGVIVALALLLRPSRTITRGPELPVPARIPPAMREVIASKMRRHAEQLPALVSKVVVLDYDGAARAAGEIFDEPGIARPVAGDELNTLLPERFFVLQDGLRSGARQVVEAAAERNGARLSEAFANLTKTCVSCHDVYLRGGP